MHWQGELSRLENLYETKKQIASLDDILDIGYQSCDISPVSYKQLEDILLESAKSRYTA